VKTAGIVHKISMENFLCHDKLEIDFNEKINFIIGKLNLFPRCSAKPSKIFHLHFRKEWKWEECSSHWPSGKLVL